MARLKRRPRRYLSSPPEKHREDARQAYSDLRHSIEVAEAAVAAGDCGNVVGFAFSMGARSARNQYARHSANDTDKPHLTDLEGRMQAVLASIRHRCIRGAPRARRKR